MSRSSFDPWADPATSRALARLAVAGYTSHRIFPNSEGGWTVELRAPTAIIVQSGNDLSVILSELEDRLADPAPEALGPAYPEPTVVAEPPLHILEHMVRSMDGMAIEERGTHTRYWFRLSVMVPRIDERPNLVRLWVYVAHDVPVVVEGSDA